jgi:hypothetical protein
MGREDLYSARGFVQDLQGDFEDPYIVSRLARSQLRDFLSNTSRPGRILRGMEPERAYDLDHARRLLMQARLWLCEMMLWFAELCGGPVERAYKAQLLENYHVLRRGLLGVMLMYAIRGQAPPQEARVYGVAPAPRGFRVQAGRSSELRAATRGVRFGSVSLRARFARLSEIIDRLTRMSRGCAASCSSRRRRSRCWSSPSRRRAYRVRPSRRRSPTPPDAKSRPVPAFGAPEGAQSTGGPPGGKATHDQSFERERWCLGPESNQRHADFQSAALPTELPRRRRREGLRGGGLIPGAPAGVHG